MFPVVLLVGSKAGILVAGEDRTIDVGGAVTALSAGKSCLAIVEGRSVLRSSDGLAWEAVGDIHEFEARCVLGLGETALVGTAEAHLYEVSSAGVRRVAAFDEIEDRDSWYTPWGGPPDTRSLAASPDGGLFANVHVGGIPASSDGGRTWTATIDIDADVHQVACHGGLILAACARGLAVSSDGGATWRLDAEGLDGRYCRAIATTSRFELVTASSGPFAGSGALYRRPLGSDSTFAPCRGGLPERFGGNIDTHRLASNGQEVAVAGPDDDIWVSADEGETWELTAKAVAGLTALALTPD